MDDVALKILADTLVAEREESADLATRWDDRYFAGRRALAIHVLGLIHTHTDGEYGQDRHEPTAQVEMVTGSRNQARDKPTTQVEPLTDSSKRFAGSHKFAGDEQATQVGRVVGSRTPSDGEHGHASDEPEGFRLEGGQPRNAEGGPTEVLEGVQSTGLLREPQFGGDV